MNCLHYLIFWVKSLRETGYHLLLGINPGINSTEGGSGVYSCRYGEGVPPPPRHPPLHPPRVPLGTFDTLSLPWLHSLAIHRRRSPKKTGGLNSLAHTETENKLTLLRYYFKVPSSSILFVYFLNYNIFRWKSFWAHAYTQCDVLSSRTTSNISSWIAMFPL